MPPKEPFLMWTECGPKTGPIQSRTVLDSFKLPQEPEKKRSARENICKYSWNLPLMIHLIKVQNQRVEGETWHKSDSEVKPVVPAHLFRVPLVDSGQGGPGGHGTGVSVTEVQSWSRPIRSGTPELWRAALTSLCVCFTGPDFHPASPVPFSDCTARGLSAGPA